MNKKQWDSHLLGGWAGNASLQMLILYQKNGMESSGFLSLGTQRKPWPILGGAWIPKDKKLLSQVENKQNNTDTDVNK